MMYPDEYFHEDMSVRMERELEAVRKRIDERRLRTAFHESGHAVMSEFLGYPVLKVSIVPNGDTRGRCSRQGTVYAGLGESEARVHAINSILISFAGHAAESIVNRHQAPHTTDYIWQQGGKGDCDKAMALIPKILGEPDADATRREQETYTKACRCYLNYQVARAYKLIRSKPLRGAVKALANELLGWDELAGEEAREVMAKALPKKGGRDA